MKFTDAVKATLVGYFNIGDQPTELQFATLIQRIQEGIDEHDHSGAVAGDGLGALTPVTLDVSGHAAVGASASVVATSIMELKETTVVTAGNLNIGLRVTYTADPPGNTSGRYHGIRAQVLTLSDRNFSSTVALRGFYGGTQLGGTGTVAAAIGVQAANNVIVVNAVATNMIGFESLNVAGAGKSVTVTNLIGLKVKDTSGGTWTVTNQYGIYIEALATGANTYAIYTNAGLIRFGDNVGIGGAPSGPLRVVGLTIYANNAAAAAGGLAVGAFYRSGTDPDQVCVVH